MLSQLIYYYCIDHCHSTFLYVIVILLEKMSTKGFYITFVISFHKHVEKELKQEKLQ